MRRIIVAILLGGALALPAAGQSTDGTTTSPAGSPLVRLLKAGRLPKERIGGVIGLVCRSGNADDLGYILGQALTPDALSPDVRVQAISALADAAITRKVHPAGDLARLAELLNADDPLLRLAAVRLAGACQVQSLAAALESIAIAVETPLPMRQAALQSLVQIGGDPPLRVIDTLSSADRPFDQRHAAIAALAQIDLDEAARRAAELLRDSPADAEPGPLLDGFLGRKEGSQRLAAELAGVSLPPDLAKLCLRHLYAVGRSDAELAAALTAAAGISNDVQPLSPEEMQTVLAEVAEHGDAARGEAVFRRGDLSCLKCHSVSGAGGRVGPDLSPVGSSSPVDYLVNSIRVPDLAVKEAFVTRIVATTDGQIVQGVQVERDEQRLVLRDATGRDVTVPVADIDDEVEGKSMMPKGLVNFLTHDEFVDLVRFLSELGKPGAYAIRTVPSLQRWRVLYPDPSGPPAAVPDEATFRATVLAAPAEHWLPAYGRVNGELPLAELPGARDATSLYLQGEFNVTVGGPAQVRLNSPAGLRVWLDDLPLPLPADASAAEISVDLTPGPHKLTFHINLAQREVPMLKVEFPPQAGSPAALSVVGGP